MSANTLFFEGGVTLSKSENLLLKLQLAAREQQIYTNALCVTLPKITVFARIFNFVGLKHGYSRACI